MSTTATLLENLAQRKVAKLNDYLALVIDLAEGNLPEPETVESILSSVQKTEADLQADVARLEERKRLASVMAAAAGGDEELREIQNQARLLHRELEAAQARHAAGLRPLQMQEAGLLQRLTEAGNAERELLRTASQELKQQREALNRERQKLSAQKKELIEKRERELTIAQEYEGFLRTGGPFASNYRAQMEGARSRGDDLTATIAAVDQQFTALERREHEIHAEMLLP
jgi:vacuolar-type H+-ATPase subunit I/STV1